MSGLWLGSIERGLWPRAVAVKKQRGRFSKKWNKTGVIVYNINHNKVLVRMVGSRRFVRKTFSSSDQLNQDERNALPSPMQSNDTGPAVGGVLDVVLTACVGTEA